MHDSQLPASPAKSGSLASSISGREVLGLALTLCLVGIVVLVAHALGITLCLFRRVTGFPCPFCGTTRACLTLLRGNVLEALKYNPLAVAIVFLGPFALWLILLRKVWRRTAVVMATVLVLIAVSLNWAYLLTRGIGH